MRTVAMLAVLVLAAAVLGGCQTKQDKMLDEQPLQKTDHTKTLEINRLFVEEPAPWNPQ